MVKAKITLSNEASKKDLIGFLTFCYEQTGVDYIIESETKNKETGEIASELSFAGIDYAKVFFDAFFKEIMDIEHEYSLMINDVFVESEDQELSTFLALKTAKCYKTYIDILDAVCSTLAEEQSQLCERLESIENYLKSSGIIHYKQFMEELIDVLDAREMLDKKSILNKMFETIH